MSLRSRIARDLLTLPAVLVIVSACLFYYHGANIRESATATVKPGTPIAVICDPSVHHPWPQYTECASWRADRYALQAGALSILLALAFCGAIYGLLPLLVHRRVTFFTAYRLGFWTSLTGFAVLWVLSIGCLVPLVASSLIAPLMVAFIPFWMILGAVGLVRLLRQHGSGLGPSAYEPVVLRASVLHKPEDLPLLRERVHAWCLQAELAPPAAIVLVLDPTLAYYREPVRVGDDQFPGEVLVLSAATIRTLSEDELHALVLFGISQAQALPTAWNRFVGQVGQVTSKLVDVRSRLHGPWLYAPAYAILAVREAVWEPVRQGGAMELWRFGLQRALIATGLSSPPR